MDAEKIKKEIQAMDYETSFSKLILDIGEGVITESFLPDKIKQGIITIINQPRKVLMYINERGLPVI